MTQGQRALLAGVLSLAVFFLWQEFYLKKYTVPAGPTASETTMPSSGPPSSPEEPAAEGPETLTHRETDLYRSTWTSRGGRLQEFLLKNYRQGLSPKTPPTNLLPLEGEKGLTIACSGCNFQLPLERSYRLTASSDTEVTFEAYNDQVQVRKIYRLDPASYLIGVTVGFKDLSGKGLNGRVGLSWTARQYPQEKKGPLGFLKRPGNNRSLISFVDGKVQHFMKEGAQEFSGQVPWVGIDERYFLVALVSRQLSSEGSVRLTHEGEWLGVTLSPSSLAVPAGGSQEQDYSVYLGPKDRETLSQAGAGLEMAVDYGWLKLLAVPILKLLQVFHRLTRNWGIAILILTVFAKLLLNPLTIKSMKQMKEMQRLQPKLTELKEKYKNDKQRLNQETMQLFRNHKVNPLGGCLPMALQMPIYIALYKVLYNAIELYHAPFFGFYRDLSAPDPYFILPILLGVAMVLQQKLTPSASADPAQQQMMMIMPVMFTAFMLFLPLGLVLYIFVNTGMSVVQQWMYRTDRRWRGLFTRIGKARSFPFP